MPFSISRPYEKRIANENLVFYDVICGAYMFDFGITSSIISARSLQVGSSEFRQFAERVVGASCLKRCPVKKKDECNSRNT